MLALWMFACTPSSETAVSPTPEPAEAAVPSFKLEAVATPADGRTRVDLRVRTPGGDLPVQAASLEQITATLDGAPAPVLDARFEPGAHGGKAVFWLEGSGAVALDGRLVLLNRDGSAWATLPLAQTPVN